MSYQLLYNMNSTDNHFGQIYYGEQPMCKLIGLSKSYNRLVITFIQLYYIFISGHSTMSKM